MDNWCLLCKNTIETNNYNIDEYLTKYSNLLLRQVLESLFDSVVFLESDSNMCYSCFELLNDFDLAEINYKRVRRKILDFFNSSDGNESSNRQKVCDETPKPVEGLDEFIKKETFETEVVLADVDENETKINIFENVFVPGDQNENVAEVKKPNPKGKGKKAKMVLKPFSCSECTKTFKTSSELKSHVSTHSNTRPYICEICGQAYKHKYALNVHVGMHKGICPFICMYCNKSFTQKGALQRHLPIHTGDKQFQCDLCGKRFVHHSSFNVHQLSHSGEKLHKCTECGLALFSGSHLKRHMRVHTGERNFVCTICDKRFAERYNLVAHEKLHNNGDANTSYKRNHRCNICKATFNRKLQLDEHLARNHHKASAAASELLQNIFSKTY